MKKLFWSVLLIIPFLTGCDLLGELTKITLPITQSITIPATPVPGSQTIETPAIETGLDSVLNEAGASLDFIEVVKLSKMEFSISNGSEDLSFLKDVNIYISATGKDDVKIASATNVGNVTELKFTTQDVDVKNFIMGESFKLKIEVSTDEALSSATEIQLDMVFMMDLKVMGM